MIQLDPAIVARSYVEDIKQEVAGIPGRVRVVGFIASDDTPSRSYARATRNKFSEVGIDYDLRSIERLELEQTILDANADPDVHGIFIYFPIFHNQQDSYLRNLVDFRKDIEAGSMYWVSKLYANDRFATEGDSSKKALLPCTPLAIIKMLSAAGVYPEHVARPVEGKIITVFNRSEVNGRPLAVMMSNDGAKVYSFDVNGPLLFENAKPFETRISRADALRESDIVITGVPSKEFDKIRAEEIQREAVCVNFSSYPNFANDVASRTSLYIPKVGPMTVAMCMRNTLRLYYNFHSPDAED